MKTITRLAMLAAAAAGFASCSVREMASPEAPVNGIPVTVNASFDGTKTVFGAPENGVIPVTWASEGEVVELIEFIDGATSQAVKSTACTVENNGMNAKFQFTLAEKTGSSLEYYAVYPASAYRVSNSGSLFDYAWAVDPQVPTPTSPDPAYSILVSKLPTQSAQPTELNMAFEHVTTYVKLNIKNTPFAEGEELSVINVEVPGKDLAGRYHHFADSVTAYTGSNTDIVPVSPENLDTKSGSFEVWVACKPFTLKAGEKAYVKLKTQKRVISKEITAPADMAFSAGNATVLNLDMTTADAPRILEPNLTLSFDFSTAKATLPSWPTAKGKTVEAVYPLDGTDYTFEIKDTYAAASQLTSEVGGYVRIPVIPGATIVSINGVTVKAKSSYACSITEDPEGTKVVTGGEKLTWNVAGDHLYVLSGTKAETPYYIYANGPLPINKLILNYYVEGETPAGPQPYEYPEVKPAFKPISNIILDSNCALDGNTLVFTANDTASVAGAKIERIGGNIDAASPVLSGTAHGDSYITTKGWDQNGAAIVYSTPLPHEISGKVRFAFSVNTNKLWEHLTKMEVCWSTDGTNWTPVNGLRHVLAESNTETPNIFKFADNAYNSHRTAAEINLSAPISAGTTFYVKVESIGYKEGYSKAEAQTMRVNVGSILYSAPEETAFPTGDNIVYAENFASCTSGADLHIGVPMYYFGNVNKNKLTDPLPGGIVATGSVTPRSGCICSNDNKVDSTYVTLPALSKLTGPTDVMLTFKEALLTGTSATMTKFPNGLSVAISGAGELGELKWKTDPESDYYSWHVAYVPIKGATAETVIKIGNTNGLSITEGNYYYLDDIVITK